jgi:predicted NBD/HSP70 family sugar kinase
MAAIQSNSLKSKIVSLLSEETRTSADLKAMTQVSLPTLRQAIQELSDTGWVSPVGRSSSTGGRPATLFGLDGETHLIIGIHLEIPTLNMVTSNLNGDIVDRVHLADQETLLPEDALSKIVDYVNQIGSGYPKRRLLGIGLAMPGFIDPSTGIVLYSIRAPQWQNFPLKTRLENKLGLPVTIENDVDCMMFAELAHTKIPDTRNLLYLGFSEGAKVSMILGGQLIKGPFGNTGIIGRLVAAPGEAPELVSVSGVCLTFDRQVAGIHRPNETLRTIQSLSDRSEKFHAILNAAESETLCRDIVTDVIDSLADKISGLIQVLQPATLIIGGALSHLPDSLSTYMEKRIRLNLPQLISNHLLVKSAAMVGSRVAAIGAVYRFLQSFDIEHG